MKLRVLVAESDPEHLLFIENALREMEEGRYWPGWMQVETHHAMTWRGAEAVLAGVVIDAILLGLDMGDCRGAETFRRVQAAAPYIPVVIMADPKDRDLAAQLIREGAQDFLIKEQIDCAPLIHAIVNAMERQRLICALRASARTDPLTSLLNRGGFDAAAGRDRALAERLSLRYLLIVAEPAVQMPESGGRNTQGRDLVLVEIADHLRSLAGPAGLVVRLSDARFALTFFDSPAESVEAAWARLQTAPSGQPLRMGMAVFDVHGARHNPASIEGLLEQAESDLARRHAPRAARFAVNN